MTAPAVKRPLPEVTPWTRPFWTGGAEGFLKLPRCSTCERFAHPSDTFCSCGLELDEWGAVGGGAVVLGVTVNEQLFLPRFPPPYVIAVVALDDAPHVRLTTNLLDTDPDDVRVGRRVEVRFSEQDGVWFPLFAPVDVPDASTEALVDEPRIAAPARPVTKFEDRAAITGLGLSDVGRRLGRHPLSLTVQACRAAVEDAGLSLADIDGIATYPGAIAVGGISEGGVYAVEQALGIQPVWHNGGMETPGQTGPLVAAMLAVASGLCRHVLCFRTVWEATYSHLQRTGGIPLPRGGAVSGDMQWRLAFGASSAANWLAMAASQYFHRYGGDRDVLGWIALNARRNAARNPYAVYKEPLTMDDYLGARMISTPLGLYDCDVPCDGSVAVIVSAAETAGDLRQPAVRVEAAGTRITERPSWDQGTITHLPNVAGPAAHLWTRTSLTQADVDVALVYDGFTFNTVSWLEALGFCGWGEARDFLDEGRTIAPDGALPLNTHGGQLSAGRLHGYGFMHEAVTQLRGAAGERQIAGAEVALAAIGGGVPGGCFLLRTSP